MAVKTKTKKTKTTTKVNQGESCYAPLEHIVPHPELKGLYRPLDKDWVNTLVDDIGTNGLDNALIVWAGGEEAIPCKINGKEVETPFFLIAGNHRREALRMIAARTPKKFARMFPDGIPVNYKKGTKSEVICTQLRENVQRKDMTPDEIFPVLRHLIEEEGMKQKDIALHIGKTEGWVSQMVLIESELPEELKAETLAGNLPVREAQKIAREVANAKKEGKDVSTDPVIQKRIATTKKKIERKKQVAKKAEVRKLGAKALRDLYQKLPTKVTMGIRIKTLEQVLDYIVGDTDDLPKALAALHTEELKEAEEKKKAKAEAKTKKTTAKRATKTADTEEPVQKAAKRATTTKTKATTAKKRATRTKKTS